MKAETKILRKIDWVILNDYIDKGMIMTNKHPEYDIWILNYTKVAQCDRVWDDYTMSCRGMVIDADGNILARPFKKFKNYEEYDPSEVPTMENFEVSDKMDGSFIVCFFYKAIGDWIIASRGSFASEQSIEAVKIMGDRTKNFNPECTYLFEIIYPENRIVVDYGADRKLVLLGRVDTLTGAELTLKDLNFQYDKYFEVVRKLDLETFADLLNYQKKNIDNEEGIVIRFESGFRIKMKFMEYCRLHSIVTNVSNKIIWKYMMDGEDFESLLERVPDEFYSWVKLTQRKLRWEYVKIENYAFTSFVEFCEHLNIIPGSVKDIKRFAELAVEHKYSGILFRMFYGKTYDKQIWKLIKPAYERPFTSGYED